ncbi:MAG: acetate kinase [Acidobacteriia bacterium]|nr:acetate kinase [Terriglobia bacterium]
MNILVINGGSSTLKATLRELPGGALPLDPPPPLWDAQADWGRRPGAAQIRVRGPGGAGAGNEIAIRSPAEVLRPVMETIWSGPAKALDGPEQIAVIGHRVVHGGVAFQETTRITPDVRAEIRKYCEFAPEHNRLELEAIEESEQIFGPKIPQVAVFDTAFHTTIPQAATVYPGPFEWYEKGIRRYGFHGTSHRYASARAAAILGRDADVSDPLALRLVTCHLGNGASLAAVRGGKSVDTTMGFTPLDGVMMGTRSGSIDPGILIYLVRHQGCPADELDRLLNKESGLKGVSGISGDMREILAAIGRGEARARLAFDVYVHRLCREIGGMVASLGGMDALVFTAGIGENCPPLRAVVCQRLAFLGIRLDAAKNAHPVMDSDIAAAGSLVRVLVIRADEDWEIARECHRLCGTGLAHVGGNSSPQHS